MVVLAVPGPPADPMLRRIVDCVLSAAAPELVILFGSRARGDARNESDYDLLVVLRDDSAVDERREAIHARLAAEHVPADVVLRTTAQYAKNRSDPGFLDFIVAQEGLPLYAATRVEPSKPPSVREPAPAEGLAMWIRRATSDLRAATQLAEAPDPSWDAVCFHAHAGAEKLLKAMVVSGGAFPPRTHDLGVLLRAMPAGIREHPDASGACLVLTALLPRARYPELPEPDAGDGRAAIEAAAQLRRIVEPLLRPATGVSEES